MISLVHAVRWAAAAFAITPVVMATAHAAETSSRPLTAEGLQPGAMPTGESHVLPALAPIMTASKPASLSELVSSLAGDTDADEQTTCLAMAVYFEARGESLEGQLAVAKVVLNRAISGIYPSNICGVITQRAQFSFIRRGHFPKVDESRDGWRTASAIAHIARNNLAPSLAANVLWYHAAYVSPRWHRWHVQAARIGAHVFYS